MKAKLFILISIFVTISLCIQAQGALQQFVSFSPESEGISLVNATIGYSQQEYEGVKIAIRNLQTDVQSVLGNSPKLLEGQDTTTILIGTIGRNPAIAKL